MFGEMVPLTLKSKTTLAIYSQPSVSLLTGCYSARPCLRSPTRDLVHRQRETRGFFVGLVLRHS
jgi:hypothetical protein